MGSKGSSRSKYNNGAVVAVVVVVVAVAVVVGEIKGSGKVKEEGGSKGRNADEIQLEQFRDMKSMH